MSQALMRTNEIIMEHKESKKTRKMSRTIDGTDRACAVENRMKPTITLKVSLKRSILERKPPLITEILIPRRRNTGYHTPISLHL